QQNNKTTKQQNNKTTKQQNNKTTKQQQLLSLCIVFLMISPFLIAQQNYDDCLFLENANLQNYSSLSD
ncbi:hypothetical protein, partial [Mesonia sp. HuA40]|uniref:hypothetical protein n=1 Tax=Mesonia sp. HuA40 TaxID=2602761 RepID=UPI001C9C3E04